MQGMNAPAINPNMARNNMGGGMMTGMPNMGMMGGMMGMGGMPAANVGGNAGGQSSTNNNGNGPVSCNSLGYTRSDSGFMEKSHS